MASTNHIAIPESREVTEVCSCYSFPWGWLVCTGGFAVMVPESGTRTTQAIMKGFSSGKNAGIESEQWWAYLSGSHPAFSLGEVF